MLTQDKLAELTQAAQENAPMLDAIEQKLETGEPFTDEEMQFAQDFVDSLFPEPDVSDAELQAGIQALNGAEK